MKKTKTELQKKKPWLSLAAVLILGSVNSFAAESVEEPDPSSHPAATPKKRKGRVPREKEADGTKAPNRFDNSDITVKSKYEVNGQALEVDTD